MAFIEPMHRNKPNITYFRVSLRGLPETNQSSDETIWGLLQNTITKSTERLFVNHILNVKAYRWRMHE